MAGNVNNILATTAAGGAGTALAMFAPAGTAGPVAVAYTAEVQAWTLTGTGTAGTFNVTLPGFGTLSGLAYNIATSALVTAIASGWGLTVTVTGTAGSVYNVTYPAYLGSVALPSFANGITGVTAITPTHTTPGVGANPATAAIPAAYKDAGIIEASSGLNLKYADTTKEVDGFGLASAARILFTKQVATIDLTFQETNHTSLEIYHRLPIGTTGIAGADGFISGVVDGAPQLVSYAAIFDMVDGRNHYRLYCPNVQNTSRGAIDMPFGSEINHPITLTCFPDSSNVAIYHYPVVTALAGA